MCNLSYCSDLTAEDFEEIPPERWNLTEYGDFFLEAYPECFPDALAGELFDFFNFLVHPLRRCFDKPSSSPKNEEIESAIKNRGTAGSHTFIREDDIRFILRPLNAWMFTGHSLRRKHYYSSDRRKALLYFDVDCHFAYQTKADAQAARNLIEQEMTAFIGVCPLFLGSDRGENGYLKVALDGASPEMANQVLDQLQEAIRLLFAKHGVVADFEIKGTITWMDEDGTLHAGRYGKLPMYSPGWNYKWHLSLVKARTVNLGQLKDFIAKVKGEVTEEDVRRYEEAKERSFRNHYLPVAHDQMWRIRNECGNAWEEEVEIRYGQQWIARRWVGEEVANKLWPDYEPEAAAPRVADDIDLSLPREVAPSATAHVRQGAECQDVADLVDEPDSFARQRKALLKFARQLKRVPTLAEALEYIKVKGLYTGAWRNPKRKARVRGILKFIARTFDARKCSRRPDDEAGINVGKYDAWVRTKFPNGIVGGTRKVVSEDGEVVEVSQHQRVSATFVSVFMSLVEYMLLLNRNQDGSLPQERAKEMWGWLYDNGLVGVKFDARKWAVCREEMAKHVVVVITDRDYGHGKAMRWTVGVYFPLLGLWKTKKQPSLLGAGSWKDLGGYRRSTETRQHNSLLRQQSLSLAGSGRSAQARPPPVLDFG